VEIPPTPECVATTRSAEGQVAIQVRDGVGVDAKWEY